MLATVAGYAFAKYDFPGGNALVSITLGAIMIPLTALIPTYLLFSIVGITNSLWAVILPSPVSLFGFYPAQVRFSQAPPVGIEEIGFPALGRTVMHCFERQRRPPSHARN